MAKIAVELGRALAQRRRHGHPRCAPRRASSRRARTGPWPDVICTSGPQRSLLRRTAHAQRDCDRLAGIFSTTPGRGRMLMTPGSLCSATQRQCYECGHEHGEGERCVSFWYAPDYPRGLCRGRRRQWTHAVRGAPPAGDSRDVAARRTGSAWCVRAPRTWVGRARRSDLAGACDRTRRRRSWRNQPPPNAEARVTRAVEGHRAAIRKGS